MYETIALFLLKHPPIEEIGVGSITDLIENYRYGLLSKEKALDQMITLHEPFLVKYYNNQIEINDNLNIVKQSV